MIFFSILISLILGPAPAPPAVQCHHGPVSYVFITSPERARCMGYRFRYGPLEWQSMHMCDGLYYSDELVADEQTIEVVMGGEVHTYAIGSRMLPTDPSPSPLTGEMNVYMEMECR